MMYSQLQNNFAQGLLDVLPILLVWVAIFLLLARKRIAAFFVIGIAVAWLLMQAAAQAFGSYDFVFAALWALLAIVVLAGVVTGVMKPPNVMKRPEIAQSKAGNP